MVEPIFTYTGDRCEGYITLSPGWVSYVKDGVEVARWEGTMATLAEEALKRGLPLPPGRYEVSSMDFRSTD